MIIFDESGPVDWDKLMPLKSPAVQLIQEHWRELMHECCRSEDKERCYCSCHKPQDTVTPVRNYIVVVDPTAPSPYSNFQNKRGLYTKEEAIERAKQIFKDNGHRMAICKIELIVKPIENVEVVEFGK